MRRLGTLLIIIGANLMAAAIALALYRAYFECVALGCPGGVLSNLVQLVFSWSGLLHWAALFGGIFAIWRGVRLRAEARRN